MHLDAGAVQADGLELDTHNLAALQLGKDALEHTRFGPSAHTGIEGVPVAQMAGKAAPLAAVLDHVEHGVERLQIGQLDVATRHRQAVRDFLVLDLSQLHGWIFPPEQDICLVPTRLS